MIELKYTKLMIVMIMYMNAQLINCYSSWR